MIEDFVAIPGKGIRGTIGGRIYFLGTRRLLEENAIALNVGASIENLENEGKTVMFLANQMRIIGLIAVADTIKSTSLEAITDLKKLGINIYMITGDNARTAQAIG